jgi:hypothetical protein
VSAISRPGGAPRTGTAAASCTAALRRPTSERPSAGKAERAVASLGLPREVEPHTALLEEVHRAAGHVAWLAEVVGQLDQSQIVHGITRTVQAADGTRTVEARATVNVWVRLYQEWHDRLVRVAKTAIDAGVEERQVRLAEAQAQRLAAVIRAILTDLGYDLEEENVRKVVRLRLLEGARREPSPCERMASGRGQHRR